MFQLGIDVSKKTLDLCLLCEGIKGKVKTRKFKNDSNAAIAVISWLCKQHIELTNVHRLSPSSWCKFSSSFPVR